MTLYEEYTTGKSDYQSTYGVQWRGQTFTVGTTGADENFDLTTIQQLIWRVGSPGTVYITLKAVDGSHLPTGAVLSSGSYDGDALTTDTAGEWKEITMSAFECQASTEYAIICNIEGGSDSQKVCFASDHVGATYAGGNLIQSANSGVDWTLYAGQDHLFKVYGTGAAPPPTGQYMNMKGYW